jgi:DNA-binding transcriptional ArsR family regulator
MSAEASVDYLLIRALAHPLRRRILKEMGRKKEEISPVDLSRCIGSPLANVSYHVRILAECEAIILVRTQPVRGSTQHFYRFAVKAEWACILVGISPSSTED